jgi:hypothetical protein
VSHARQAAIFSKPWDSIVESQKIFLIERLNLQGRATASLILARACALGPAAEGGPLLLFFCPLLYILVPEGSPRT